MMPFPQWRKLITSWYTSSQFKLMSLSAKKRLDAKGYIVLPFGSFFHWIEKDWFDKAVQAKALVKNRYGQWLPASIEIEKETEKGKKEKRILFSLAFLEFEKDYNQYKKNKATEQYILTQYTTT